MSESKQLFKAGQSHGEAEEKTNRFVQSAKDTAQAAADKVSGAAQSTKEYAQDRSECASGFLQQKGEQGKDMAHGAAESVKNTLGTNGNTTSTNASKFHST